MKTRAAVVHELGKPMEIEELDLDGPQQGEVLVRYTHAGLCHSDLHIQEGDLEARLPMVMGHEGAGVVEEVGGGVVGLAPGDKVVCSFMPVCGTCRYCASGRQSICDMGADILSGNLPGGRFPLTGPRGDYGAMSMLGTFSQWGVLDRRSVVKVPDDTPLEVAALVGCGVPTGWGSAVHTGEVRPGDTVVVIGTGGIGINAVQGARHAGARHVVAVDPVEFKRHKAVEFGATHAFATAAEALAAVAELTRGRMAESAILTVGLLDHQVVAEGFAAVGKGGIVVVTGINRFDAETIRLSGTDLTVNRKQIRGSQYGDCNPTAEIPLLLDLHRTGQVRLDELVTRTYLLDEVNQGYEDLMAGANIRGVVVHDHG